MSATLKKPKEWPVIGKTFKHCTSLDTSTQLLLAGPIGAYLYSFLDIDAEIKTDIIHVMRLLEMMMYKSSTPGNRATVRRELPEVWCRLELALPLYLQTMVAHYCVHHAVDSLEETGPFHVANMLDMERFQTVFKGCAKAKKNVMKSIVNNYLLLEVSLDTRLTSSAFVWTTKPAGSSTAAYLKKSDGANRMDRLYTVKGKVSSRKLGATLFGGLLKLWRAHNTDYDRLVTKFENAQRNNRKHKRTHLTLNSIAEWKPKPLLTPEEQQWASMLPHVKVVLFFSMVTFYIRMLLFFITMFMLVCFGHCNYKYKFCCCACKNVHHRPFRACSMLGTSFARRARSSVSSLTTLKCECRCV